MDGYLHEMDERQWVYEKIADCAYTLRCDSFTRLNMYPPQPGSSAIKVRLIIIMAF